MGIPTLIKTQTASDSTSLEFVDGTDDVVLDGTYDEYMFVFTDINPATDATDFSFQVNATDDAGGDYDTSLITSTYFRAYHQEDDGAAALSYATGSDQAQAAGYQQLMYWIGSGSDESGAGVLHLFNPSSTTYVKHFYSRCQVALSDARADDDFIAGYINDTTAIDEISFKMASGNFDGVIQLYGIA
jgi:hypothetical protein